MSTVGQVIDRVLRDWLYAPDDQPTRFALNGAIASNDTTIIYDSTLLAPEEEDLLGPGALIEIGTEQIQVGTVNDSTNTITGCVRGVNGTTAAAHSSGDVVVLAPSWARKTIFDAVADAVEQLWPELYAVSTQSLTISSTTYTEVPAAVIKPMWLWARPTGSTSSTDWMQYANVQFLDQFPPSSTGKAITVADLAQGATGYLVYQAKFTRPAAETDSMSTLGLEDEWEQLVVVATVAYLISGRDLSAATADLLTEQLGQQGFPAGSGAKMREGFIRYQAYLVEKAKKALRLRYPPAQVNTTGF